MGITHLSIHTGKTKKLRAQTTAPTDPEPVTGDLYLKTTAGSTTLSIYNTGNWYYFAVARV